MGIEGQRLGEWLSAEPFSLGMSSGFFGFFAHAGMLSALEEAGLSPKMCAGSSAGALVAGTYGAGLDAQAIGRELFALKRADFWDIGPGFGLLRGKRFHAKLKSILPVQTFEGCRVPLSISAYDLFGRTTRTFSSGDLVTAIRASCAVPVLFQPVFIERRPYCDGGVADRPGLAGVPEGERLFFHHLAERSPWRTKKSMSIPRRPNQATLVINGLPRSGPFKLEMGRKAYIAAREATKAALDTVMSEDATIDVASTH
jgi:NTE family protein